jgi:tRNA-Thr(GGU) m(6)t(6)A37 methyltransferase TsaA
MQSDIIQFVPIGRVRSPVKARHSQSFREVESEIVIRDDLIDALQGLDGFSHLEVIFYLHLEQGAGAGWAARVHPMGFSELPEVGLFATRSPHRPNRLGLTLCRLLEVRGNVIRTRGLDALDGSPVLDIKAAWKDRFLESAEMRFPGWTETALALWERFRQ